MEKYRVRVHMQEEERETELPCWSCGVLIHQRFVAYRLLDDERYVGDLCPECRDNFGPIEDPYEDPWLVRQEWEADMWDEAERQKEEKGEE